MYYRKYRINKYAGAILLIISFAALLFNSCASTTDPFRNHAGVAVWDLDNLGSSALKPGLGEVFSTRIIEVLQQEGDILVIERERLLLAIEELNLGISELADEQTRLKLGRFIGARFMVFGAYQIIEDLMRVDLRIVDVETGRVVKTSDSSSSEMAGLTGWLYAVTDAAEGLLR